LIKLLRIDERLVHGQVAVVWTKYLNVNRIIVADDEASRNETQKYAMSMAIPEGTKLSVVTVAKAIELLNDPRANKLTIFIVVKNPENALKILRNVEGIPEINIGNYGRMTQTEEEKVALEKNLYVTQEEILTIKEIASMGIATNYQAVPNEKAIEINKLLK